MTPQKRYDYLVNRIGGYIDGSTMTRTFDARAKLSSTNHVIEIMCDEIIEVENQSKSPSQSTIDYWDKIKKIAGSH